jgi:hypothetical protein
MSPETTQAATEAAARVALPKQLYRTCPEKSNAINDILATLMFSLQNLHAAPPERQAVLSTIDRLIRLKIHTGLLVEGQES